MGALVISVVEIAVAVTVYAAASTAKLCSSAFSSDNDKQKEQANYEHK